MNAWKLLVALASIVIIVGGVYVTNNRQHVPMVAAQQQAMRVVSPATDEELAPLRNFLDDEHNESYADYDDLSYAFRFGETYCVDINNDGIREYVICYRDGSANIFTAIVAAPVRGTNAFQQLPMPDFVDDSYAKQPFHNVLTDHEEFLLERDGILYMCYDEKRWGCATTRSLYFWNGDTIDFCVDNFWIEEQRRYGKALCAADRYDIAHPLLHDFEERVRGVIDPVVHLSLQKDVAYAAYKNGFPHRCLTCITDIKNSSAYEHAPQEYKTEIGDIERSISSDDAVSYSYEWLLGSAGKEIDNFDSKAWEMLMRASVPDIANPKNSETPWRYEIAAYLIHMIPSIKIIDQRYVVFDNFKPHRGGIDHGFFWCDVQQGVSAVAIGSKGSDTEDTTLYVTSRSLNFAELPAEFLQALRTWIQEEEIMSFPVYFYDRHGNTHEFVIS